MGKASVCFILCYPAHLSVAGRGKAFDFHSCVPLVLCTSYKVLRANTVHVQLVLWTVSMQSEVFTPFIMHNSACRMQALCIRMTLAAYLNLLARKRAADGLHVSGSNPAELSSSGCGISTINKPRCQLLTQQALQLDDAAWEAAEVRSWQTACEQHAVLPDTHHKLLKAVGCSSKAVVWAAVSLHISTVEYQSKAANMWGLINAYQELVEVLDSGKLESGTAGHLHLCILVAEAASGCL